jgi:site-specific DNA recombinase
MLTDVYLRALTQRVEFDAKELRIMGSKSELLGTLVTALSAKTAGFGVPSSLSKARPKRFELWRASASV